MSEENQPEKSRRTGLYLALGVAAVLFLYVFSIGPVVALSYKFQFTTGSSFGKTSEIIYVPLFWLYNSKPLAKDFLDSYIELWFRLVGV